jgi:lipase chaperone LimK
LSLEFYGEAAAERLARLDDEWADWERRLNAARAERTRLLQSANLSEALRKQEMDRYIQDHFKPEESLRVRSLLRL